MVNSEEHTLYDRKNRTNSYDFLRIKRVHALLRSVSFKPIFVDFTPLIDMLLMLQFSIAIVEYVLLFLKKIYLIFLYRSNCKTILNSS